MARIDESDPFEIAPDLGEPLDLGGRRFVVTRSSVSRTPGCEVVTLQLARITGPNPEPPDEFTGEGAPLWDLVTRNSPISPSESGS